MEERFGRHSALLYQFGFSEVKIHTVKRDVKEIIIANKANLTYHNLMLKSVSIVDISESSELYEVTAVFSCDKTTSLPSHIGYFRGLDVSVRRKVSRISAIAMDNWLSESISNITYQWEI